MPQFIVSNNVNTTLAQPATAADTTLTLTSSTGLPALASGEVMPLTLNDAATKSVFETVYVTAISGAVLTVERNQEGTAAQSWLTGDYAFSGPTSGTVSLVSGSAVAGSAVTVAASPMTYNPSTRGTLFIEGGVFTAITVTRGGTVFDLDIATKAIPLTASDTATLTYTTAPTALSFLPL
ncbi:MAG: hypothetical protein ACYCRF_11235 [Acidithiobacillus sp.]